MLISGLQRLEAVKTLGWTEIPVTVLDLSGPSAVIAECDENLCGASLTVAERALFTRRRKEAYEALHPEASQRARAAATATTPVHGGMTAEEQRRASRHAGLTQTIEAVERRAAEKQAKLKPAKQRSQERPRISSYITQNITIGERFRTVEEDAIQAMMASIQKIGLRTPITVKETEDDILLVAGCCRLLAALRLGWTDIYCFVLPDDATDDDLRLWQIAENLHCQDLTAQERAEHVAEWVREAEKRVSGQVAQKLLTRGRHKP